MQFKKYSLSRFVRIVDTMPVSLLYSKLHMQLSILQLTPSGQTFGLKLNL